MLMSEQRPSTRTDSADPVPILIVLMLSRQIDWWIGSWVAGYRITCASKRRLRRFNPHDITSQPEWWKNYCPANKEKYYITGVRGRGGMEFELGGNGNWKREDSVVKDVPIPSPAPANRFTQYNLEKRRRAKTSRRIICSSARVTVPPIRKLTWISLPLNPTYYRERDNR